MKPIKTKKLSIAHLHWGFPPIIGGVETHLTILLPALYSMGHKVHLLTGAIENEPNFYKYKGVSIYRTPIMDLNWLYKRGLLGLDKEVKGILEDYIDKTNPDVIHVHNMAYFSPVHARTLEDISLKKGIPLILTAHNVWDDNLFINLIRDIEWKHIIAVSHFIKRELIGIGFDDRRISVVHHGIDHKLYSPDVDTSDIFKKYPRLNNKIILFHPARMGLAKGCDVSIKAVRIIRNQIPNVLLVLAGTKNIIDWGAGQQKDIAYMIDLVDFFKLRNNVLIDAFKLEDIPKLYAASSVCVYPSTSCEPFGLTMLESLASGKPMVVTDTGGMPEIIKDGINGFIVPIKNFEALASRVIQLLKDDRLRERLGYTGREMIEQNYTKKIVANNTLNVYKKNL